MKLILITIGLLALGVAGIAIKIWAKKDGEFAGTCASQNPLLNKNGVLLSQLIINKAPISITLIMLG